MRNAFFWVLAALLVSSLAHAGPSSKCIRAVRTGVPPVLDGNLDDPQWKLASPVLDFTQFDPSEGEIPTEVTAVRVLYDDRALYIGVMCYDGHPGLIVSQLSRRDRSTEADRFSVIIDSYHDRQTAFLFSTNVAGVQSDGALSQDGMVYDINWDAVWSVRTRRSRDGWSAEFEIPFRALRFSAAQGHEYEWGVNFRRYISRKREVDEWVMVPRKDAMPAAISPVSPMGTLVGLKGIDPPMQLALAPYAVGKSIVESPGPDRPSGSPPAASAGLDMKIGLSPNFTAAATINPDFGQVELDQAVLNLTVFETQFPEKRPFFLEGAPLFAFGTSVDNSALALFFSRRIGKTPSGSQSVSVPLGGTIKENPQTTSILGAAKITGRSSGGFSLGAVATATGEEQAVVVDSAGARSNIRTEPRGSYDAIRWKQEFSGGTWIGGITTLAARESTLPAATGGIDWNVRLDQGSYALDGYLAAARSSAAFGGRDGVAGRLLFARIAAEHWLYFGSYDFSSRWFNCNDVGFFAQPRDEGGYLQVMYRENFAAGLIRRYVFSAFQEERWNWDRVRTTDHLEAEFSAELLGFWVATMTYDFRPPAFDDAERGIVGLYRRPADHALQMQVTSDSRLPVNGTLDAVYEFDAFGKRAFSTTASLDIRPSSWAELTPSLEYRRSRHEQAWVFPDGNIVDPAVGGAAPFSVFGRRALNELNLALRGTVSFTRTISIQIFSQLLLARGLYDTFSRLDAAGKLQPYDFHSFSGYVNNDFNQVTLNANALLRWEYQPGSEIYLVWTQERYGDSGDYWTPTGRRLEDAFSLPREDVFLLKINYMLPL